MVNIVYNMQLTIYHTSNSTPRYIPKGTERVCLHKNLYADVHNSITHNNQKGKKSKCPSTNEWIIRMWYINRMEYYSAIKENEILMHATTHMNLKNKLSERSQTQKLLTIWFHLNEISKTSKCPATESNYSLPGAEGRRKWGVIASGYGVSFGTKKTFWNLTVVDGYTTLNILKATANCTL